MELQAKRKKIYNALMYGCFFAAFVFLCSTLTILVLLAFPLIVGGLVCWSMKRNIVALEQEGNRNLIIATQRKIQEIERLQTEAYQQQKLLQDYHRINAMAGVEFEYFLKELFSRLGYSVELTPASNDYGADLLISKEGNRSAVQAKCYSGSVSNTAVQEAFTAKEYYGTNSASVVTNSTFTRNATEMAARTGVSLIDGERLAGLVNDAIGSPRDYLPQGNLEITLANRVIRQAQAEIDLAKSKQSPGVHLLLLLFTIGIGNIIYFMRKKRLHDKALEELSTNYQFLSN
ncbi:MAG: restriction endonuclease [Coriobacteriia bacterium]|nr:restriction endonuclease [Coriobacteriia bacterium]